MSAAITAQQPANAAAFRAITDELCPPVREIQMESVIYRSKALKADIAVDYTATEADYDEHGAIPVDYTVIRVWIGGAQMGQWLNDDCISAIEEELPAAVEADDEDANDDASIEAYEYAREVA